MGAPSAQNVAPVETAGQSPNIKTEPTEANGHSGLPSLNGTLPGAPHGQAARDRAANILHQKYGAAAANSVSQLQAQSQAALAMPGQQRPQNSQASNGEGTTTTQTYPTANNSQMDGTGDDPLMEWRAEAQRRRQAAKGRSGQNDRILAEQLRLRMRQLEGGGLLLPHDQHDRPSRRSARSRLHRSNRGVPSDMPGPSSASSDSYRDSESNESTSKVSRAQFDGAYDGDSQEEDDDNAINSDLDDPDDFSDEENEGEEAIGQVMLCTYDKVQRVKNKWKCTLKDGILTTGGKEYVYYQLSSISPTLIYE